MAGVHLPTPRAIGMIGAGFGADRTGDVAWRAGAGIARPLSGITPYVGASVAGSGATVGAVMSGGFTVAGPNGAFLTAGVTGLGIPGEGTGLPRAGVAGGISIPLIAGAERALTLNADAEATLGRGIVPRGAIQLVLGPFSGRVSVERPTGDLFQWWPSAELAWRSDRGAAISAAAIPADGGGALRVSGGGYLVPHPSEAPSVETRGEPLELHVADRSGITAVWIESIDGSRRALWPPRRIDDSRSLITELETPLWRPSLALRLPDTAPGDRAVVRNRFGIETIVALPDDSVAPDAAPDPPEERDASPAARAPSTVARPTAPTDAERTREDRQPEREAPVADRTPPRVRVVAEPMTPDGRVEIYIETNEPLVRGYLLPSVGTRELQPIVIDPVVDRITWEPWSGNVEAGVVDLALVVFDAAGNQSRVAVGSIDVLPRDGDQNRIDTDPGFSPNGDGRSDTLAIRVTLASAGSQAFLAISRNGRTIRVFRGLERGTTVVRWDGRDGDGARVPEGRYALSLERDGNDTDFPRVSTTVEVDLTPPDVSLRLSGSIVSPDGDDVRDAVAFTVDSAADAVVDVRIETDDGALIEGPVLVAGAGLIGSDGTIGSRLPDGVFRVVAGAEDQYGNRRETFEVITVDTRPVSVVLLGDGGPISPNGDGNRDTMEVALVAVPEDRIVSWRLSSPTDPAWSGPAGEGAPPDSVILGSGGAPLPAGDGTTTMVLEVLFDHAGRRVGAPIDVVIDLTAPSLTIDAVSREDAATVDVSVDATDTSGLRYWYAEVTDGTGAFVTDAQGRGDPPERVALTVPQGITPASVTVEVADNAGNISRTAVAVVAEGR